MLLNIIQLIWIILTILIALTLIKELIEIYIDYRFIKNITIPHINYALPEERLDLKKLIDIIFWTDYSYKVFKPGLSFIKNTIVEGYKEDLIFKVLSIKRIDRFTYSITFDVLLNNNKSCTSLTYYFPILFNPLKTFTLLKI